MDDDLARLDRAWDPVVDRWRQHPSPVTVLFSGGVDSGLIAWELRSRPATSLVTVGVAGAADLEAAARSAPEIGLPWSAVEVAPEEVLEMAARIRAELVGTAPVRASIFVAFALGLAAAPPGALLCGQGADELFLGYAHFRGLSNEAMAERARDDLRRLLEEDWPRTERIARRLGRTVQAPYLDPDFIAAADAIPIARRAPDVVSKPLLRRWAAHRNVPGRIANRSKKALQFGSGVERVLRRNRPRTS
jgi:asparagine synthase (glutamine-hydrolysing)